MSGLAALTANYTDSEDEDQNIQEPEESKSSKNTPLSQTSAKSTPTKQKINLVSYGDIPDENDDKDDKDAEPVPMELESDEEKPELNRSMSSVVEVDAWNEGGKLPPEPEGTARKNNFRHFDILVH